MGKHGGRSSNDDRSDSMNPNNSSYQDSMDNRANQLNPEHYVYNSSRAGGYEDDDDYYDDEYEDLGGARRQIPISKPAPPPEPSLKIGPLPKIDMSNNLIQDWSFEDNANWKSFDQTISLLLPNCLIIDPSAIRPPPRPS